MAGEHEHHDHEHHDHHEHDHEHHDHDEEEMPDISEWSSSVKKATCPACGAAGAVALGGGLFCPTCGEVSTNPGYTPPDS